MGETDSEYKKRISFRTYVLIKFSGGQITFQHHLEARSDNDLKKTYQKDFVYMNHENGTELKYGVGGTSGFTKKVSDAQTQNKVNNYEPLPKLLYTVNWLNMTIEGKHFEVMPDSEIKWK